MILNDYYGVEDEIKNQVKLCLVWIIVSACHNNIIKQYFSLEGWYFFLFFSLKERKHKQFYYYSFITIKQHSYWLQIKEQGVQIIMSVMTKNCLTVVARKRQLSNYRHFFFFFFLFFSGSNKENNTEFLSIKFFSPGITADKTMFLFYCLMIVLGVVFIW